MAALNEHIGAYVDEHEHAVRSLAAALSSPSGANAGGERLLDRYHDVYPGFLTVFIADRQGIVRDIFPPRDAESPPISDREYFVSALQTRQLAMSDVILGRLSYVPIVTIAMPIFDAAGAVVGVAGGSLDLSKFERFVEGFRSLPDARITVVDQHARVIFASGETTFTPLQSAGAGRLVVASAAAVNGIFRYGRQHRRATESERLAAVRRRWRRPAGRYSSSSRWSTSGCNRPATTPSRWALMLLAFGGAVLGARAFARRGHAAARGGRRRGPQHLGARRPGRSAS